MSSQAAFDYEEDIKKVWIYCRICDGRFVNPEFQYSDRPSNVCIWCFSRTTLYQRWLKVKDIWERREDA